MKQINWWVLAKWCLLLMCFGLVASVRADDGSHSTRLDSFTVSWPQAVGIGGFMGALVAAAAEFRQRLIVLERNVQTLMKHVFKEGER